MVCTMPRIITHLTRKEIMAKPSTTATNKNPDKRNDGNNLTLLVYPSGKKTWRSRYTLNGKTKDWLFANYDEISEIKAREYNLQIQQLAKQGKDPKKAMKADAETNQLTFGIIAESWLTFRQKENRKDSENIRRLNKHILPILGDMPHHQITKQAMQEQIIDPIVENGTYAEANKTKQVLKAVFDYAIDTYEILEDNPAEKLKHPKYEPVPFKALVDEHDVKRFIKDIWQYQVRFPRANIHVACLLKLSIWLASRPSEVRCLTWSQYNKDENLLNMYASKVNIDHVVILPRQARELMQILEDNRLPNNDYIFPTHFHGRNQPLSEGATRKALEKLGYKGEQTMHGLRTTARTLLDEELEQNTRHLESQLTHKNKDPNGLSYNRSKYKNQRARIMQKWADYLDALRNDEDVSRFKPNSETDASKQLEKLVSAMGKDKLLKMLIAQG